jgi:hypothetical protein
MEPNPAPPFPVVLDSLAEGKTKIPALTRNKDGFSRSDVANAFQNAFVMIGGVSRLALWANKNPDKFYPLYSRLMPSTSINFGDNTQVIIEHAIPPGDLDNHE